LTAEGRPRRIPVYVVLQPRTLLLDVAGPLEVLRRTNREQADVRFDVHYIGPSASVLTSIGITLSDIEPLPDSLPADTMILLAGDVDQVMTPTGRLARVDSSTEQTAIVDWLRAVFTPRHTLISICSGALLAGRAGLLDGHSCTTHYGSCAELAMLAPKARVLENRLYVEDGNLYSSAGVTAGVDLMLHIVRRLTSHRCAAAVARYLVVYLRRGGADPQLSPWLEGRNHLHPAVHRLQDTITQNPAKSATLRSLARASGVSSRHLTRLFHENTGMSITAYRNRPRVAIAHELLSHTSLDMESISERAGFGSTRQLRRAWNVLYSSPPRETRPHAGAYR
jgi:transcriptional regulator GlxA family with amidase domain